jgi:hypothetical protein
MKIEEIRFYALITNNHQQQRSVTKTNINNSQLKNYDSIIVYQLKCNRQKDYDSIIVNQLECN